MTTFRKSLVPTTAASSIAILLVLLMAYINCDGTNIMTATFSPQAKLNSTSAVTTGVNDTAATAISPNDDSSKDNRIGFEFTITSPGLVTKISGSREPDVPVLFAVHAGAGTR